MFGGVPEGMTVSVNYRVEVPPRKPRSLHGPPRLPNKKLNLKSPDDQRRSPGKDADRPPPISLHSPHISVFSLQLLCHQGSLAFPSTSW